MYAAGVGERIANDDGCLIATVVRSSLRNVLPCTRDARKAQLLLAAGALLLGWGCGARRDAADSGTAASMADGGADWTGSSDCGSALDPSSAAAGSGGLGCAGVLVGVGSSSASALPRASSNDAFAGTGAGAASAGTGGSSDAPGASGGVSAEVSGAAAADAADGGGACRSSLDCAAAYPCQPLQPSYTCRGQFADWMPADSPASFINNGDGTVTDTRSRLEWQRILPPAYPSPACTGTKRIAGDSCTWQQATDYCSTLLLAGSGWRLPTRAELESLVDFGKAAPAIDLKAFPEVFGDEDSYWSSSPYVDPVGTGVREPNTAVVPTVWCVEYRTGASYRDTTSPRSDNSNTRRVRCVRSHVPVLASTGSGGAPPVRYTYPADGAVYDTRTKLTWQREADIDTYTQAAAQSYCSGLTLAGGNWRVPSISELLSIVDVTNYRPAIDPIAFPGTPRAEFWSASASVSEPGNRWCVNFSGGNSYTADAYAGTKYHVRCVR